MMYTNIWYVAEFSKELGEKPVQLRMLGREPTPVERAEWVAELEQDGETARADLVWTLANSLEFLFQR